MARTTRAIVASLALFITVNANALVINTLNTPIPFTISDDIGGGVVLTATGAVTVTGGFNSSSLSMAVTVNNTSTLNGNPFTPADGVVLTAWGFGVNPDMTGISFDDASDGGMIDAKANSDGTFGGIEVCAWGGNSCSGDSANGVLAGATDSFTLMLDGNWGTSVTFDPVGARFLTADGLVHSLQCTGACTAQADPIPEPQTLALTALALLAMVGTLSQRRRYSLPPV